MGTKGAILLGRVQERLSLGAQVRALAAALRARGHADDADRLESLSSEGALVNQGAVLISRLAVLADRFELSCLDTELLLCAVLPDLDGVWAECHRRLTSDGTPHLSLRTAPGLLGRVWIDEELAGALAPAGTLLRFGLLDRQGDTIRVAEQVRRWLLGDDTPAAAVANRLIQPLAVLTAESGEVLNALGGGCRLVHVRCTSEEPGLAAAVAALESAELRYVAVELANDEPPEQVSVLRGAVGFACLNALPLVVHLGNTPVPAEPAVRELLSRTRVPIITVSSEAWPVWDFSCDVVQLTCRPLDRERRSAVWDELLGQVGVDPEDRARWVPSLLAHRMPPQAMAWVVRTAADEALVTSRPLTQRSLVQQAAERAALVGGGDLTTPRPIRLADLTLTAGVREELGDVLYRARALADEPVVSAARPGVSVLLSGPPGTGKTSVVHALANELDLPLMAINISAVVDKYIGETEKKLETRLLTAERTGCLLFFDEADALFGSRSAVSDSKDRYANQQISYLLTRIEAFAGIVCLATNLIGNIDRAFTRRMDHVLTLPEPGEDDRAEIWRRALAGTEIADLAGDLARVHQLTPGEIGNIVAAAHHRASRFGEPLRIDHLELALTREYTKLARRMPVASLSGASR